MKKFFAEFKKFISRGNVMDMAVGTIVGAAFTAIVTALSNGILKPIINTIIYYLCGGNADALNKMYTPLVKVWVLDEAGNATNVLDMTKSIYIDWGAFVSAIINFLLIAFVLFTIVKVINQINSGWADVKKEAKEMTSKEVIELRKQGKKRKEIKKILKQRKAEMAEKKKLAEEEAKKNAPPTQEQLLTQILEELKKK